MEAHIDLAEAQAPGAGAQDEESGVSAGMLPTITLGATDAHASPGG